MKSLYGLNNVSCSFNGQPPVLSIDDLVIERGNVIAILGESGSGKSTLLNLLGHLHPIDPGEHTSAHFHQDEDHVIDLMKDSPGEYCSFIFQNSYLFESATVELSLELMDIMALPRHEFEDFLKNFGMPMDTSRISSRVRDLSGGQKRRLALISALLRNRDTILADELTSDLDPVWAAKSLDILTQWQKENDNRTIIWVTHNYEQALQYADRVLILQPDGSIHPSCKNETGQAMPVDWPTRDVNQLKKMVFGASLKMETSLDTEESAKLTTSPVSNTNEKSSHIHARTARKHWASNIIPALKLALLTSFEPGSNIWDKLKKVKILPHIAILGIILTLSCLAFGVWEYVGDDVDRQKQDPQTQHFVVVQNMRAENTRLRQIDLDQLNKSLSPKDTKSSVSPFQNCFETLSTSTGTPSKVFGRLDQIESVLLKNLENGKTITRRARLLLLDPKDPVIACMKVKDVKGEGELTKTLGQLLKYPDELKVAFSQQFYDQVIVKGHETPPSSINFARGYSAKGPAFEIAGLMPVAPYNDRFAIDGITTTSIFKTWRSITGENELKDYDAASVYFTEDSAKETISEMQKRDYIFNVEAYNKFSSIVELRNVIEDGFKIFALIVVFSILSTIGFLAWLFLSKFSQPIGILAAHKRPTPIVLVSFLAQLGISLVFSAILSAAALLVLSQALPSLEKIISVRLFLVALSIVAISAMIGAISSFIMWRATNKYPMQMLRR